MHTFENICDKQGHHSLILSNHPYNIEVAVYVPENVNTNYVALVAHPHPLQEGTMDNKVVVTVARALAAINMPVIRFNFRGVGQSTGTFDKGLAETDDLIKLIKLWQTAYPQSEVYLAGFSFGSYVAFRAAQQIIPKFLLLIAPPVQRFAYHNLPTNCHPTVIFQGIDDDVVAVNEVVKFAHEFQPHIPVERFEATGHFFHGKLIALKEATQRWVKPCL